MKINLYNNYGELGFAYKSIISDLEKHFEKSFEISLILVDLEEIKKLNLEFRHIDQVTDVISFESDEEDYLGDIFICMDKVSEQAVLYGHSQEREFAFLLLHGILHLQGYDHQDPETEKKMFSKQEQILNALNYRR
ncbi:MAG: rRNA maturation RNase YbeY [Bacilli bacterium]|nr:rRNA maturation RNase YbeY [Bacilli bacterium]